ncbi:MAG: site-specific integrase [Halopseudomonas sp.]|uniref:site-specific integrase n=1 Tax=Halopseudomonas sp. TaxID=2901191 RepID=UPI003001B286
MGLSKQERVIIIRHVPNVFSEISSYQLNESSIQKVCSDEISYFTTPNSAFDERHDVYLFPFLLNSDGSPWDEANLFLFKAARDHKKGYSLSNSVRQKAAWLLDYKIFCEKNNINYMDFTCRKPMRPTYRYFSELVRDVEAGTLKRNLLNKKTRVTYDLYSYLSKQPGSIIDIERVDSVKSLTLFLKGSHGRAYSVNVEKRGQTLRSYNKGAPVHVGFVSEYGEELRPLKEHERIELVRVLNLEHFSVDERIMHLVGMETGARKQTILTMRMKHLDGFSPEKKLKDGTYKILAGPGTGIDTKFDKKQALYFPQTVVDMIRTYANCKKARERRSKFVSKNGAILGEGDMYIFLSPEGDAHYMAKSDPRYKITKSKSQGRNTYYTKKKILKYAKDFFPKDFTFHWTRATYALGYYRWLQPLSAKGLVTDGDIISMVQKRMHHSDRLTTENYLKLFDAVDERVAAQGSYENQILEIYGSDGGVKE